MPGRRGARPDRPAALRLALGRPEAAGPHRSRPRRRAMDPPPRRAYRRGGRRLDRRHHGCPRTAQPGRGAHRAAGDPPAAHASWPRQCGVLGAGRSGRAGSRRGCSHAGADRGDAGTGGSEPMSTLVEILRPGFLLRDALVGSVLVGLVCPLVGVYFVLRRMIFLGVALPQLSAAGIAFAFLMYRLFVGAHQHFELGERVLAMLGSSGFTLGGLLVLAAFERRGRETVEARIGATYGIAGAATILFLAADPHGEAQMVNLLTGDLLATTGTGLTVLTAVFGA